MCVTSETYKISPNVLVVVAGSSDVSCTYTFQTNLSCKWRYEDEFSSDEDSVFDDYTQIVPTKQTRSEILTVKMPMNKELVCIYE